MATIDFAYQQDADGMFDLVIDRDAGDFAVTPGLETSMLVSLFSDRRADQSEVSDPMQRRGWIGNLVAETVGDNHGSGLWLYEQRRLTDDIALGVKTEAVQSFDWMVEDGLATYVEADVRQVPSRRVGLDAAADLEAVHVGHHHVEKHDVAFGAAADFGAWAPFDAVTTSKYSAESWASSNFTLVGMSSTIRTRADLALTPNR